MGDRWVRLDADFFRHPKILKAGHDARNLYLAALCYCGNYATDGVVSRDAVPAIAADAGTTRWAAAIERLEDARLWVEHPDGWLIPDFVDMNQSRDEIEARRAADRARQRARRARQSRDQLPLSRDLSRDVRRESHDRLDETTRDSVTSPTTDRPRDAAGAVNGQSVEGCLIAQAAALYGAARAAEKDPATLRYGLERWTRGVVAKAAAERQPAALAWLNDHPGATAADLARSVFGLSDHEILIHSAILETE